MLTSDLIKTRHRDGKIIPVYLRAKHFENCLALAQRLIDVFEESLGATMAELDAALREVAESERDRLRVSGLIKLLRDRCEFDLASELDPIALRAEVFGKASEIRCALGIRDRFDREKVLASCAQAQHISPQQLMDLLFADLPGAQSLQSFRVITATALLQRYNLALAQGVLLRATRVVISLDPTTAPRCRQLFRAMKFRRLMHRVSGSARKGYEIVLDGPMSLFESTQRYGLQLALFLPVLVSGEGWRLEADLRWGKERVPAKFVLTDQDGLISHDRHGPVELEEVSALFGTFARLKSPWTVRRTSRIYSIKGSTVFVPDLLFEHQETKKKVYLEAFGYWNRDAVFERVDVLSKGFTDKFVLAVSTKLRVSAEVATHDFPGAILVYANAISANSVRKLLDEIASG